MRHFIFTVISWIIVLAFASVIGYFGYRAHVEIVKTAIKEMHK